MFISSQHHLAVLPPWCIIITHDASCILFGCVNYTKIKFGKSKLAEESTCLSEPGWLIFPTDLLIIAAWSIIGFHKQSNRLFILLTEGGSRDVGNSWKDSHRTFCCLREPPQYLSPLLGTGGTSTVAQDSPQTNVGGVCPRCIYPAAHIDQTPHPL